MKKGDKVPELDKKDIDERTNKLREQLIDNQREKNIAAENKDDSSDYSSGIESDNDLDLLVEQEVLQAIRMRKELKAKLKIEKEEAAARDGESGLDDDESDTNSEEDAETIANNKKLE